MTVAPLVVAVSKGRTVKSLVPVLERAGGWMRARLLRRMTALSFETPAACGFLLLKADDVPTYVEHGAADLGICGRDVLREHASDLLVPLDLEIGRCKMVVAAPKKGGGAGEQDLLVRVATKYPRTAAEHFAARGVQDRDHRSWPGPSSFEAPIALACADVVVDLVETGETLRRGERARRSSKKWRPSPPWWS